MTLIITRSEAAAAIDLAELIRDLHVEISRGSDISTSIAATSASEEELQPTRTRARINDRVTAMVLMPGHIPGIDAYTVKVHAKNPDRNPALTGVICLHDAETGDLLAIMDSGWLTSMRTGVGAALGSHTLATRDADHVGVIGAGRQGRAHLTALATLRPIKMVVVHDIRRAVAEAFALWVRTDLGISCDVTGGATEAAKHCDILSIATWSRTPLLTAAGIRPGVHITALGSDEPGKAELSADLLAAALVVTDDLTLSAEVTPAAQTTLGAVLRQEHPGRANQSQITTYCPVGLPSHDLVIAWHVFRRAHRLGIGTVHSLET